MSQFRIVHKEDAGFLQELQKHSKYPLIKNFQATNALEVRM